MELNEFYAKYANTPLGDRFQLIEMSESDPLTLNEIYKRVEELDNEMRPKRIEQDRLINKAVDFWENI